MNQEANRILTNTNTGLANTNTGLANSNTGLSFEFAVIIEVYNGKVNIYVMKTERFCNEK